MLATVSTGANDREEVLSLLLSYIGFLSDFTISCAIILISFSEALLSSPAVLLEQPRKELTSTSLPKLEFDSERLAVRDALLFVVLLSLIVSGFCPRSRSIRSVPVTTNPLVAEIMLHLNGVWMDEFDIYVTKEVGVTVSEQYAQEVFFASRNQIPKYDSLKKSH